MFSMIKNWWKNYNLKMKELEIKRYIAKIEEVISSFTKSPKDLGYKEEQKSLHEFKYVLKQLKEKLLIMKQDNQ